MVDLESWRSHTDNSFVSGKIKSENYLVCKSMKLPNGEQTEIAIEKLINYCLNPEHSSRKNKARVFKSRLDITQENVEL